MGGRQIFWHPQATCTRVGRREDGGWRETYTSWGIRNQQDALECPQCLSFGVWHCPVVVNWVPLASGKNNPGLNCAKLPKGKQNKQICYRISCWIWSVYLPSEHLPMSIQIARRATGKYAPEFAMEQLTFLHLTSADCSLKSVCSAGFLFLFALADSKSNLMTSIENRLTLCSLCINKLVTCLVLTCVSSASISILRLLNLRIWMEIFGGKQHFAGADACLESEVWRPEQAHCVSSW